MKVEEINKEPSNNYRRRNIEKKKAQINHLSIIIQKMLIMKLYQKSRNHFINFKIRFILN